MAFLAARLDFLDLAILGLEPSCRILGLQNLVK